MSAMTGISALEALPPWAMVVVYYFSICLWFKTRLAQTPNPCSRPNVLILS